MKINTLIGNRIIVRRITLSKEGETEGILIPTAINTKMMREEQVFFAEVVTVGTGKELAEKQPEIQKGTRVIANNQTGTQVLEDGTEIISALDVLAVIE